MTHEAFAARIVAIQQRLYRVSASLLARQADREDAVQACIEKAWRELPLLRDEKRLEAWITRILIRQCRAIQRRRRFDPAGQVPPPPDADADLYRFFASLPDKLRLPMTLHHVEGLDVKDIAYILRLPEGAVKTRLHRGREIMQQDEHLWQEAGDAPGQRRTGKEAWDE